MSQPEDDIGRGGDPVAGVSPAAPQVIIIVGLARSGTTYLSRRLHEKGIPMWGWEMTHGEDADVWGLNTVEGVVNPPIENQAPYAYAASDEMLARLVAYKAKREVGCDGAWGFKDPRIVHLLAAYVDVFPSALYVCCIRNPLSIVWSQLKRKPRLVDAPGNYAVMGLRLAHIAAMQQNHKLNMHWFNYDGNMEDESVALSEKVGVDLELANGWEWKQAGRTHYEPGGTVPQYKVVRSMDERM